MKFFACVCAILCFVLTIVTCSIVSSSSDAIRGEDKSLSVVADSRNVSYSLLINELKFHKNQDVKIQLIPVATSQEARIEALYSEELDEYGFFAKIINSNISIGMTSEVSHPIKTFNVVIYAPVHHIEASGSGYRLLIDKPLSKQFSLYLIGDISTTLALDDNNYFLLASAGSSLVDITGKSKVTNIAISGNSSVFAEYLVCDYAKVHISGSSLARISVLDELQAMLKKNSTLEYLGNPVVNREAVDTTSTLVQVAEKVSSELN